MNHIYRIIFNRASGVFQVVSELAKGKVKSAKTSVKLTALCMALVSGVVLADEPAPTSAPASDNTQKLTDLEKKYQAQQTKIEEQEKKIEEQEKKLAVLKKYVGTMPYDKVKDKKDAYINNLEDVAIGVESRVNSKGGVAIGYKTNAANNSVAIGNGATVRFAGGFSVAIGYGSLVTKSGSIALGGYETKAQADSSISIGILNTTGEQAVQAVSIGAGTNALGKYSTALGTGARAIGDRTIALGNSAKSYNYAGISIGDYALSRGEDTISIGRNSEIEDASNYSIAMGNGAYVGKKRSPASGSILYIDKERDTLVADGKVGETGSHRTKSNDYSIANPEPEKRYKGSIAIGLNAKGYGFQTIAIGGTAEASGSDSLSVGIGAESRGLYSSALGSHAIAYKDYSSAFGHFSAARAENSLALGANTRINEGVNGGVALGSDSFNDRDLATIGYDISKQATKLEINGNKKQMTLLGDAGKQYQKLQDEIAPLKEAYEKERQNYADLAELRNILYDLPKKEEEVNGLKANMEKLKAATNPNQAEIDNATKSYETAKNELEKIQEKLTALQTKTGIQETAYDTAKTQIEAKLTDTEKKADEAESKLNKKQQEQNKLVSTWKGTAGSVSVGNEIRGITRQITGVAAGTADTDAVNLAQLKSAGLRFAVNSDNQGFAGTDKTHNFYKHVGDTLSILGESGVGYKADLYSSRNLITYHDNDGIRIAMKTNPVFDRLTLVNKDDPSKSLELYAKTDADGKAHLIQAEKAPETDNAVKEKPQTPNNGTDGNHNTAGQDGANGQNGQAGGTGSAGNAGSAGNQGADGAASHNGSTGQGGANGQNGQAGGTGSAGSAGSQGADGSAGHNGSAGQGGANGQNGQAGGTGSAGSAGSQGSNGTTGHNGSAGQGGANGQNGANANHGINGNNGTNGLSANETDLTRAAIKGLNQATGEINRQIRKTTRESRAGIAAAMAMGQIYPVQGKRFTVGAAAGTYRGQSAVAVGVRYTPKPNMVISLSGSADTNNGVGAATGVSFGF
ncbi:ESPR-type extended signal peptide-containing protein [Haemophilus haemolyticus]|uniref:ESPR-type extended signal peptide-containing protein n=1 Tax=Haemophilus haemolyticus TaxID=726 RepID=UPI000E57AA37|nr:YadA-like family protein [Haemophilus haemolyticus]